MENIYLKDFLENVCFNENKELTKKGYLFFLCMSSSLLCGLFSFITKFKKI